MSFANNLSISDWAFQILYYMIMYNKLKMSGSLKVIEQIITKILF